MVEDRDPSFLALDPSKRFLFAVNEHREFAGEGHGQVASYAIDQETGELTFLSRQSTHGGEPCHLTTDPTGRYLIVANHEHGSVAVLPIDADGRLRPATARRAARGLRPRPDPAGAARPLRDVRPAQQRILVADKGIDKVMIYRLDAEAGQAGAGRSAVGAAPQRGRAAPHRVPPERPLRLRQRRGRHDGHGVHLRRPSRRHGRSCTTSRRCRRAPPASASRRPRSWSTRPAASSTSRIAATTRSPSSRSTSRPAASRRPATSRRRANTPRNFAFDPSGTFLYAANQNSDTIVHFRVDARDRRAAPRPAT